MSNPSEPTVKCLVWDLDNTLWNGTLLEDEKVVLDEAVRRTVVDLDSRGILQSVASRNDFEPAWARLVELGIDEYFVLPQINWGPKSASVALIADALKFAPDTIAFIDDTPGERAEVTFHLPSVRCYPADFAPKLASLPEFQPASITEDSARRRQMYQAGFEREARKDTFEGSSDDFIRSLEAVMEIRRAGEEDISRLEELTLRTSQMNATGVHYSDADLRALRAADDHEVLVVSMADRFGPYGAVGVLLLARAARTWHVKLLATSCRVVSVGAGSVILRWLIDEAAAAGVHLLADFKATERNRMMEIAYRFAGLSDEGCSECDSNMDKSDADAPQRLHLVPSPQCATSTLMLDAVSLAEKRSL